MCFQGKVVDFRPTLRRHRRSFLQCLPRAQTPESDENRRPWPSVESETSSVNSCSTLTDYYSEDFSIEDDQDEEMPDASSEEPTGQSNPQCEFAGICPMGTEDDETTHRKIISHIFGRNKSATKVFPQYVWVHYCRKHYQRARYRAAQWPFTQCDLLLESLSRMEQWGGVQSFQLILRRREQDRVANTGHVRKPNRDISPRPSKPSRCSPTPKEDTRRKPRAMMAPVPKWLRERTGDGLNFNDIREIIHQVRQHIEQVRRNGEDGDDGDNNTSLNKQPGTEKKKSHRPSSKRSAARISQSPILFPDVEIIPTFKQWALDQRANERKPQERKDDGKEKLDDSAGRVSNSTSSPHEEEPSMVLGSNGRVTRSMTRINNCGGVQKP